MAAGRKIPGLGAIVAALVLAGSLVGAWFLLRLEPEPPPDPDSIAQLDVVCHGRIDSLNPIVSLEPIIPGRVAEVFVKDGQSVGQGEALMRLDDEAAKLREEEAAVAVEVADLDLQSARQEAASHPSRLAAAEASSKAADARALASQKLFEERKAQHKMFMTGTPAELAAAEAEVAQYQQLAAAERARVRELKDINPQLGVDAAEARKRSALIAQKQAAKMVRDCVLTAPSKGTVLRVQVSVGETIAPTGLQPALVFRPDGPFVVRAEIEQEFLGRVRAGMPAEVKDDARPNAPTWKGHVLRVGDWVARKRSVVLEPGEINDVRTIECVITLDGTPEGILIGQRVRTRIGATGN